MENLYHVVSHVEDYKYFVPWCRDSTVYERKDGHVKCKLVVGFPPLVERYISVLTLVPPNLVVVSILMFFFVGDFCWLSIVVVVNKDFFLIICQRILLKFRKFLLAIFILTIVTHEEQ